MGKLIPPEQRYLYKRIDEILWQYWDPIGVYNIPETRDEYYPYIPEVFHLALEKANETEIAEYLLHIEKDQIGGSGNPENCLRVARMILEIKSGDENGYKKPD